MLTKPNAWKLQDAKARLSELVRQATTGEPQSITVHGKEAVVVVDPKRFDIKPKPRGKPMTGRDFIEASKKYRGIADEIDFEQRGGGMEFRDRSRGLFDEDVDEKKR